VSFVLTETFVSAQDAAVNVDKLVSTLLKSLNNKSFQILFIYVVSSSKFICLFSAIVISSQASNTSNANCVI
jgi:hypothetical protein